MAVSFLNADYELPIINDGNSRWAKLKDGPNTVRILGDGVAGYEWWINNEVTRVEKATDIPNGQEHKHFWMIPVSIDYGPTQIWTITQATIQRSIRDLDQNKNWGDAINYDLTITRTGQKLETSYTVVPNPKSPMAKSVKTDYEAWVKDPDNSIGEIAFGPGYTPPTPPKKDTDDDDLPF